MSNLPWYSSGSQCIRPLAWFLTLTLLERQVINATWVLRQPGMGIHVQAGNV
jgi:hypothetical protein